MFGGPQVSHGGSAGGSGGGGDLIPCGRYIVVTSGSYHRRLVISKVCHIEGVSHPMFVPWEVCLIEDKSYRRFVKFATSGLTIEGFCNIESLSHQSLTIEGLSPRRFGFPKVRHIESLSQQGLTIERVSYRRFVTSHRRFVSFKVCHIVGWLINLIEGLSHQKLSHQVLIIDGLLDTQPSRQASGHPVRPSEQHGSKHPRHTFRHPGRRLER